MCQKGSWHTRKFKFEVQINLDSAEHLTYWKREWENKGSILNIGPFVEIGFKTPSHDHPSVKMFFECVHQNNSIVFFYV